MLTQSFATVNAATLPESSNATATHSLSHEHARENVGTKSRNNTSQGVTQDISQDITQDISQEVAQLYAQHQPWLYQWLWKKLGCSFQAADLAQDTFVKVLTKKNKEHVKEPRAYLQVLAQRSLFDFWRRKELEKAYSLSLSQQAENYVPCEETRAIVLQALNQLDQILYTLEPMSKQVFVLSQLRQFTYQEISEQMNISVMTVRRHMKQAILACASVSST